MEKCMFNTLYLRRYGTALIAVAAATFGMAVTTGLPVANAAAGAVQPVVQGNHLVDSRTGQVWTPHGSSWPGLEYSCVQGWTPSLAANSMTTAASWGMDVARIPLNQDCWLGTDNAPIAGYKYGNDANLPRAQQYQKQVQDWVTQAHNAGMAVILDLHWAAPNGTQAYGQRAMADNQSAAFWNSVATTYKNDPSVMFELFNEPYSRGNNQLSWQCWRDGGCQMPNVADDKATNGTTFTVTGMATLVSAVRNAGAKQPLLLGGLNYANDLSQWLNNKPNDTQLVAAWHNYQGQGCSDTACWNTQITQVAKQVPVLMTETGYEPNNPGYFNTALTWANQNGIGYLPWAWWEQVDAGNTPYALYKGTNYTPTPEGTAFKQQLTKF